MHNDPQAGSGGFRHTNFEKPTDKPPKQYTANETVPENKMGAEPVDVSFDNEGDLSTKFMR